MVASALIHARDRLLQHSGVDEDVDEVLQAALRALHDVAVFRWAAVMTVDPRTILPTAGVVEGFDPSACAPFWDLELVSPGYNKFADLARRAPPVSTLFDATDGELTRSPLFNDLYAGLGASDELRVAFVLGSTCWGVGTLIRDEPNGAFTDAELRDVQTVGHLIARALRQAVIHGESQADAATAILVVDGDNRIEHLTADGHRMLESVRGFRYGGDDAADELPGLLLALLTRARHSNSQTIMTTRIQAASGRWLRVTAAPTEAHDGHVALTLEPARPADLLPMMLETYGLTEREITIVMSLARGLTSKDIAAELTLSPYTVRDHVKAIYRKCGVNTRGELVARLFTEHLRPAFEERVFAGD
ncbi:LuxR C-terminal-related transcriptional regulator [Agromyces tropicus]|uniref:LuxR C-terminal-related transcriptional regulator n=1 Tax=Agromyces tropicus TaxID=555371 RepID=UPI0031D6EF04